MCPNPSYCVVAIQAFGHVRLFVTSWTVARQASLSFTISWSMLRLMPIESMLPSKLFTLYHPFSSCPQSFPASGLSPVSCLYTSGGQSIGASALVSVLSKIYSVTVEFKLIHSTFSVCKQYRCLSIHILKSLEG